MPMYLDREERGRAGRSGGGVTRDVQLFNTCFLFRGRDPGDSALIDPFDLLYELAVRLLFIVVLTPRRVALDSNLVHRCHIVSAG